MYARTFNGTTDEIYFTGSSFDFTQALTFFFVGRKGASQWGSLFQGIVSATERWSWEFEDTGVITLTTDGGATSDNSFFQYEVGAWEIWATTKVAGSAVCRMHRYRFNSQTWTHETASGPAIGSPTTTTTSFSVGVWSGNDHFNGQILCVAAFDAALSDAILEQIPAMTKDRFSNMDNLRFSAFLDTPAITPDVISYRSSQSGISGTTVFEGPIPWPYGGPPALSPKKVR